MAIKDCVVFRGLRGKKIKTYIIDFMKNNGIIIKDLNKGISMKLSRIARAYFAAGVLGIAVSCIVFAVSLAIAIANIPEADFMQTFLPALTGERMGALLDRSYVEALSYKKSLFLWCALSAIVIWFQIKKLKKSKSALVARILFIWAPIAIGWGLYCYFSSIFVHAPVFYELGMMFSSIFLVYEFFILPEFLAASP